jgi:hypothetical protein
MRIPPCGPVIADDYDRCCLPVPAGTSLGGREARRLTSSTSTPDFAGDCGPTFPHWTDQFSLVPRSDWAEPDLTKEDGSIDARLPKPVPTDPHE